MDYKTVVRNIQSLKIQGAENIAICAVKAIKSLINQNKPSLLLKAKKALEQSRPTEPCMFNSLNYIFKGINFNQKNLELKKEILQKADFVLNHFECSENHITEIGARKIKKGSVVFTHCHSSTVMNILKHARNKVNFEVHNTETRPLYQGRITATELLRAKIPVTMYVDSGARLALKDADIMMLGCDAITSEGQVINKIGSEMFAEIANSKGVPVYVCTNSWKFDTSTIFGYDPCIESRAKNEVWKKPPAGLKIDNHAFEKINPNLITGIISELGIFPVNVFIEEFKENYNWLF